MYTPSNRVLSSLGMHIEYAPQPLPPVDPDDDLSDIPGDAPWEEVGVTEYDRDGEPVDPDDLWAEPEAADFLAPEIDSEVMAPLGDCYQTARVLKVDDDRVTGEVWFLVEFDVTNWQGEPDTLPLWLPYSYLYPMTDGR